MATVVARGLDEQPRRCYLHPDVATFEARDDKPIVYGPKTCQVAPATPAMEPLPAAGLQMQEGFKNQLRV